MMIKRIFPHPLLTTTLWIIWLLLNNSLEAGHLLLGFLLAFLIARLTSSFRPECVHIRKPLILLKFAGVVLADMLIANVVVAKLILGPNKRLRPGFFYIDLDIHTSLGISVLANTISLTPGTVACDLTADRSRLLIHALHVEDIPATISRIKERYEHPLKQVFTPC